MRLCTARTTRPRNPRAPRGQRFRGPRHQQGGTGTGGAGALPARPGPAEPPPTPGRRRPRAPEAGIALHMESPLEPRPQGGYSSARIGACRGHAVAAAHVVLLVRNVDLHPVPGLPRGLDAERVVL